jgi:hypothetical protein
MKRAVTISACLLTLSSFLGAQQTIQGPVTVNGNLTVTGTSNSGPTTTTSINGVLNATSFSGSDIGAKVNAAFASLTSGGTVGIPAGTYTLSTTIILPNAGYHLTCDAGTILNYTGTADAILIPSSSGVPGQANLGVNGQGGCLLQKSGQTGNGIHIGPSNQTYVTGMRIEGFQNGIFIAGGNGVQILNNTLKGNSRGLALTTVTNYAPNAVHVSFNEFANNGWGVYSYNSGAYASQALGNVYRANVFEGNLSGDLYLAWDAHTVVEDNYFENSLVGVSIGTGLDNVYDIHVEKNYFAPDTYRSEVEIGYGFDFFIEENHAEPANRQVLSNCSINIISGPNGSAANVVAVDAFSQHYTKVNIPNANEICSHGAAIASSGGTFRVSANQTVAGSATFGGNITVQGGTIGLGTGQLAFQSSGPSSGGSCGPEGFLFVTTASPAHLYLCSSAVWRQIY